MSKRKYSTFMMDEILGTNPRPNDFHLVDLSNVKNKCCEICGKGFDRQSLLIRHKRIHTGVKPFECAICKRPFSTSSSLNTHIRIHYGIKPCRCEVCGKQFTAGSNLYYHQLTHKENKPHKCSDCEKSFSTPSELKCHRYLHSGEHPYRCVCGKRYGKANLYKSHLMRHLGIKPEKCPLCVKNFTIEKKLKDHVKYIHGIENYKCKIKDEKLTIDALERAIISSLNS
ncbi:hypothetical protein ACOME3_002347 [Neoechinorhynchus agilis]